MTNMNRPKKDPWDISKRTHTKYKLELIRKIIATWLTIWINQFWVGKHWYIIDLFAGQGYYIDGKGKLSGSSLIFLEEINKKKEQLEKKDITLSLYFVEKKKKLFNKLKETIESYLKDNSDLKRIVNLNFYHNDCNAVKGEIIETLEDLKKNPLFLLIDPSGLQIKKHTISSFIELSNRKDIMINYMQEGVQRVAGLLKKKERGNLLNEKEIKSVNTLREFLGDNVNVIQRQHLRTLEQFIDLFLRNNLKITAYDMPYPDSKGTLYYLLYMSRNQEVVKVIRDIFYRQKKEKSTQTSLLDHKFNRRSIKMFRPNIRGIKRKSLLYQSKVEYGDWTINHIVGCMHGCKFPCYAYIMAKRFGWVEDYEDWRNPKIVENTLEILEKELKQYRGKIKLVHLCFMTDPFMYDVENEKLINDIKELTLNIIERLNKEGIKVTTLTKGIYPNDLTDKERFDKNNEYGITLVSLNKKFKQKFERFSAPYKDRINALKMLSEKGHKTWVSIEPYPTKNLDPSAESIETLLEKIGFVDKIVFGRLNYNMKSNKYLKNEDFYKRIAKKVIIFCKKKKIPYHIKGGTPYSTLKTAKNFFK